MIMTNKMLALVDIQNVCLTEEMNQTWWSLKSLKHFLKKSKIGTMGFRKEKKEGMGFKELGQISAALDLGFLGNSQHTARCEQSIVPGTLAGLGEASLGGT